MGPLYNGEKMTPIEKLQYQIELLEREKRYIQEDIEDLREKIDNEIKADELAEKEYTEIVVEN